MVLPSQMRRPSTTKRSGHRSLRRGLRGRWPWLIVIAVFAAILIIIFWTPQQPEPASAESPLVSRPDVDDAAHATANMPPEILVLDDQGDREADSTPRYLALREELPVRPDGGLDLPRAVAPDGSISMELLGPAVGVGKTPRTDQDPSSANPIAVGHVAKADPSVLLETTADPAIDSGHAPIETIQANSAAPEATQEGGLRQLNADIGSTRALMDQGKDLEARRVLSRLLDRRGRLLPMAEGHAVRLALNEVNDRLLLSRALVPGDLLVDYHIVRPGELLLQIGPRYKVPYRLIMRINGINDPKRLRADSRIKVVHGPFHGILTKSAYRLDVYANGSDGARIFVYSFAVGLGAGDSTPEGKWIVRSGKKENPDWRNPQTHKYFAADDLKNPIGEHWIPIKGIDETTKELHGYGIHGTIEPGSIGKEASMGCVRMLPDDVALLFEMLAEDESRVTILP